jgi:predicted ArsR family transcriptional regulator
MSSDTQIRQLEDVKRLLMLLLMKLDATSDEIALALQVDSSAVRRSMPAGRVRKIVKRADN